MTQWEYKQHYFYPDSSKEDVIETMNEFGEKGWELMSYLYIRRSHPIDGQVSLATFKRKVCYYEGKASPI